MKELYSIIGLAELPLLFLFMFLVIKDTFPVKKTPTKRTVLAKVVLSSIFCGTQIASIPMRIYVGDTYFMQIILACLWLIVVVLNTIVLLAMVKKEK